MTIGGLTYTASGANTAAQVATAFANINAGSTSGASAGTGVGKGSSNLGGSICSRCRVG